MVRTRGVAKAIAPGVDLVPQQAVRWLSPTELARSALARLLAGIFGVYADKRELQQGGTFEQPVFDHSDGSELWLDFTADVGDGFDATYTVASMLAAPALELPGVGALPRGELLVLGGDEVYPSGSTENYEQRMTKVYAAALPEAGLRPALYAIPGNHDWYDGLTAFLRVFAQRERIGGWQTAQRRSYFALKLPHRWWMYAVDIQLDTYIDEPQLQYFREVATQLREGDGIILCTARPSWYDIARGRDATSMRRLEHFVKTVVSGTGARVRLVMTGDSHHYARYVSPETGQTLLTCGLGGAFLAATHDLPDELDLAPRLALPDIDSDTGDAIVEPMHYELAEATWPTREQSSKLAWGVLRLPLRNPGFWGLVGGVHAAFTVAALSASVMWTVALAALIVGGAIGFTDRISGTWGRRLKFGVPHGLVQLGLSIGTACAWRAATSGWPLLLALAVAVPVVAVVVGLCSAELVAVYLLIANRFGAHVNELFAAQSIEDYKGFARLRIGREGVTVYPVVVEKVGRGWVPGGPGGPMLVPTEPLAPRLAEEPFSVPR